MPKKLQEPWQAWLDNSIQFPRLIAELEATGGFTDEIVARLCDSMDLHKSDILELIDRAQATWDDIKAHTTREE